MNSQVPDLKALQSAFLNNQAGVGTDETEWFAVLTMMCPLAHIDMAAQAGKVHLAAHQIDCRYQRNRKRFYGWVNGLLPLAVDLV